MTPEERMEMNVLCEQIATEKDPKIFDQLVRQLNDLLEQKYDRIQPHEKSN